MTDPEALVTAEWLAQQQVGPNLSILDASWYLPAENRDPYQEYRQAHIPGAVFFDIDKIADQSSSLPHMLPAPEDFDAAVAAMGIGADSRVVIYDGHGLMSAARVWWMFRVFGHRHVHVLNGGLPAWRAAGYALIDSERDTYRPTPSQQPLQARLDTRLLRTLDDVRNSSEQIVDARPAGRFHGVDPEPRPGLRCGHIPGSYNVPFVELLDPQTRKMLPPDQLRQRFSDAGLDLQQPVTASCGSGVTACVLALGLYSIGVDAAVYDGSWAEWGAVEGLPIEP